MVSRGNWATTQQKLQQNQTSQAVKKKPYLGSNVLPIIAPRSLIEEIHRHRPRSVWDKVKRSTIRLLLLLLLRQLLLLGLLLGLLLTAPHQQCRRAMKKM